MNKGQLVQMLQNKSALADVWFEALVAAMEEYSINTDLRVAAFMAQALHESAHFRVMEENLHYKPKVLYRIFKSHFRSFDDCCAVCAAGPEAIANRIYSNRMGNGDEESGDGWKYRGEGIFQLTGANNFAAAQEATGIDLVTDPSLAKRPVEGSRIACWHFWVNRCNKIADAGDIDTISNIINTGSATKTAIGQETRHELYDSCLSILEDD